MRKQLLEAMERGAPFVIKMADGTHHKVAGSNRVALGQRIAVVVTNDDLAHLVPLSKVMAVSYARRR